MGKELQRQLPLLIPQLLSPNQIGLLTITAVEVSGDLRHAHAYVSFLHQRPGAIAVLNAHAEQLTEGLRKTVRLTRSLQLIFKADASQQHVEAMSRHFSPPTPHDQSPPQ